MLKIPAPRLLPAAIAAMAALLLLKCGVLLNAAVTHGPSLPRTISRRGVFSNAFRQSPSPSASIERIMNCICPRAAYTESCPCAITCIPSSGGAGMRRTSRDQTTHESCAVASRSEKYQ